MISENLVAKIKKSGITYIDLYLMFNISHLFLKTEHLNTLKSIEKVRVMGVLT